MQYRWATENDLDLLAEWNHQLIDDEGHRNSMTVPELRKRMAEWLAGEYRAVIFEAGQEPIAYALYRENAQEVYLRQFFVDRNHRRKGAGREAMDILRSRVWPSTRRLTVDVLTANAPAVAFWRSVGYQDYCLTLEIMPESAGAHATRTEG